MVYSSSTKQSLSSWETSNNQTSHNFWQVVHSLPGRVRLRVPELGYYPLYAQQIQQGLQKLPSVTYVRLNKSAQSLTVCYEPEAEIEVKSCLLSLHQQHLPGLNSTNNVFTVSCMSLVDDQESTNVADADENQRSRLFWPVLAVLLAMSSRILTQWHILRYLAIASVVGVTLPIAQRATESLWQNHRFNIDCLDLLALSLSAWQGKLLTPALVITLHELGDTIREQTARSTQKRTTDLTDMIGRWAWVKYGENTPVQIESDRVQVGDIVVVYPGEQIPVDGTVLQGQAIVDQQNLTGESMPVTKSEGDTALASTLVRSGQLYIRAERVASQTRVATSIAILQQAPVYDTRIANYAEQLADRLIVPSLVLAVIVLAATRDTARAAAILTLDFVTGIRVSIPTAFLGALNHSTRHGVLVRSGRTLENLAEIDTIVFDKTGTLTQGTIAIVGIKTVMSGLPSDRVLQLVASSEKRLNHPVAEAIVNFAIDQGVAILPRGEWNYQIGLGVQANIDGCEVLVGSERFLQKLGVNWPNDSLELDKNCSVIYVASDRQFQGVIEYRDPLRPESLTLIQQLQNVYHLDVHLLTGDNTQYATQVAKELGIPLNQVYAEAFPEQKAKVVRDLHRSGHTVAFVGDGLNDSIALAYADVSVSFERGSDIARETADVVLMNNNLLDLLEAISISRQTRDLIEQNTALVVAPNLIALGLATSVGLNPLIATVVHNGSAILAGLNSLRPLWQHQLSKPK